MNRRFRLFCVATLSRFRLELGSKGSRFFNLTVQLFEQGRHVRRDLRWHRRSLTVSDWDSVALFKTGHRPYIEFVMIAPITYFTAIQFQPTIDLI
jgi:hypothetical protein